MLDYRGSFRYASREDLDRALCDARDHLEDDASWMQFLFRRGTTVFVDATLPPSADRQIAAAVLGALADTAVEGHVDVTIGSQLLDAYVSQSDRW